jgi:hypothetical protein
MESSAILVVVGSDGARVGAKKVLRAAAGGQILIVARILSDLQNIYNIKLLSLMSLSEIAVQLLYKNGVKLVLL